MSDSQPEKQKAIDPLETWREMRDAYMKVWAQTMGETVNTDEYAKNNGVMLDTYLSAAAPLRDAQKKIMVSALEQMNMPSRADFVSLAERLTNVEMLLDNVDAKLTQIHQLAMQAASQTAPKIEAEPRSQAVTPRFAPEVTLQRVMVSVPSPLVAGTDAATKSVPPIKSVLEGSR